MSMSKEDVQYKCRWKWKGNKLFDGGPLLVAGCWLLRIKCTTTQLGICMVAVMMTFAICVLEGTDDVFNTFQKPWKTWREKGRVIPSQAQQPLATQVQWNGYVGTERENKAKVGAALENFPVRKQIKYWFHVHKKNINQKTSRKAICATPKIGNFHFRRWWPIST